ncbi:Polyadenylate-binding protein 2 [Hibiscus syriacus]|uniref:Polyadenylate-binding protein 2 n=1 Tax=Hibiscus syriacus TaxID=106335 RepID=A0A6A2WSB5_HIBSY|nr:Polyadenylate-binding protein 2 [Hibiscus syriacus]
MEQHVEQEHEMYGGEIPDEEGEMDADVDMPGGAEDYQGNDHDLQYDPHSNSKDLEDMKKRLKEIEDEAGALREIQAKVQKEMGGGQGTSVTQAEKEEVDSRSIYVGNVDYACTPEEVQQHFQSCGTVNRVTILTDKFGQPKGFAYVEFVETDAVQNAVLLNESELHGRVCEMNKCSWNETVSRKGTQPVFPLPKTFMPALCSILHIAMGGFQGSGAQRDTDRIRMGLTMSEKAVASLCRCYEQRKSNYD